MRARRNTDIYPGDFAWTPDWSQMGFHGATDARVLTNFGVYARSVQLDYDDRPFFIHVSYTHPYDPYLCQQEHWDRHDGVDIPLPRTRMPAQ